MKKEKTRGKRRWIVWAAAAVVLVVVGVLVYDDGGGGSSVAEIPGGFELTVAVLERDGTVTLCRTTDGEEIKAAQGYIRQQEAHRLRARDGAAPEYPFLALLDGEGKTARRAVWAGGTWVDGAGRAYTLALDAAELLACLPSAEKRTGTLADFPNRALAATISGTWDARLLLPAAPLPEEDLYQIRARERSDDKLSVTAYNPRETEPVVCRTDALLDVQLDGRWYAVPPVAWGSDAAEESVIEPQSTALFTATTKEVEERYGTLIPGHYRLVLLTYASEFDVEPAKP